MSTLARKRVLVVGAGGIGCPVLLTLAQAGARHVTLIDDDVVDLSNLHRQILYTPDDVGLRKVDAAKARLIAMAAAGTVAKGLELEIIYGRFDAESAPELLSRHDIVVEGTDSPESKFLCNDVAVAARKPFVIGSAIGWRGQVFAWTPDAVARQGLSNEQACCYRCLFESPPADAESCAISGVAGPLCGLIGGTAALTAVSIVAPSAISELASEFAVEPGFLRNIDVAQSTSFGIAPGARPDCPACGNRPLKGKR